MGNELVLPHTALHLVHGHILKWGTLTPDISTPFCFCENSFRVLLFGPTQSKNTDLKYLMLLPRSVVQFFIVDVMSTWKCLGKPKMNSTFGFLYIHLSKVLVAEVSPASSLINQLYWHELNVESLTGRNVLTGLSGMQRPLGSPPRLTLLRKQALFPAILWASGVVAQLNYSFIQAIPQ